MQVNVIPLNDRETTRTNRERREAHRSELARLEPLPERLLARVRIFNASVGLPRYLASQIGITEHELYRAVLGDPVPLRVHAAIERNT